MGVRRAGKLALVKDWLLGEQRDTSSTVMEMGGKGRRQQESAVLISFLLSPKQGPHGPQVKTATRRELREGPYWSFGFDTGLVANGSGCCLKNCPKDSK